MMVDALDRARLGRKPLSRRLRISGCECLFRVRPILGCIFLAVESKNATLLQEQVTRATRNKTVVPDVLLSLVL